MKDMYQRNSWLVIITVLLSLTFWGGILALPILGLVQIIMSIIIILSFNKLTKTIKFLFILYVLLTVSIFLLLGLLKTEPIVVTFFWAIISMFLACIHLYITYKIKKHLEQNNTTLLLN